MTSGRHKHPDHQDKSPSKIYVCQPDILKNREKSRKLLLSTVMQPLILSAILSSADSIIKVLPPDI